MEKLHTEGMYGFSGVGPSKIFFRQDAEFFLSCAAQVIFFCFMILMVVGHRLNFLDEKEENALREIIKYIPGRS